MGKMGPVAEAPASQTQLDAGPIGKMVLWGFGWMLWHRTPWRPNVAIMGPDGPRKPQAEGY